MQRELNEEICKNEKFGNQVWREVEILSSSTSTLYELINNLKIRLEPVMRIEPDMCDIKKDDDEKKVPLANDLSEANKRVTAMRINLENILRCLEI